VVKSVALFVVTPAPPTISLLDRCVSSRLHIKGGEATPPTLDVSMPESVDLASHHVIPESGIECERLDSYYDLSPDEPLLPRPPPVESKQYAVLVTDDPVSINGSTERDCYRVVTESLADPKYVAEEWC